MKTMKLQLMDLQGFLPALAALRLPYGLKPRSFREGGECDISLDDMEDAERPFVEMDTDTTQDYISKEDLALARRLVVSGDEHAKVLRGVVVWLMVEAPLYWWTEMVTYRIGVECLSSTSTMHTECRGLKGAELQEAKGAIPMSHKQTRILMLSYQALRRIYFQRRNHRLPEWRAFCKWIETLPFAQWLITPSKDEQE